MYVSIYLNIYIYIYTQSIYKLIYMSKLYHVYTDKDTTYTLY